MLSLTQSDAGTWLLSGQVTVDTINSVLPQVQAMITSTKGDLVIDLSQVTRVDSASIALLLEGMRMAMAVSKTLRFTHFPQKMLDIIHVSNLDGLLL